MTQELSPLVSREDYLRNAPPELVQLTRMSDVQAMVLWSASRMAELGWKGFDIICEEAKNKPWRPANLRDDIALILKET